ncbi:IniB N-terminal domain-containing protein [Microbacterium sp. CJ88]|uniref:IniB N-terminal domain-containing protein n=1 Tax=Microbacterium sp. CJ88 TaxID=3445672 RepID=UPI003F65BB00
MTMPLATIAEALIEFILSLLRDPAAAAEFQAAPEATLAKKGLGDACADDVRAVAPVIVDRPDVQPRHTATATATDPAMATTAVQREIMSITNSFHIDNRATIVDQSVNQNIWAHGDVNQIFDQEAILNTGDGGAAGGHDATVDHSDTTVTVGDVSIGNTDTTTTITDSFDNAPTTTETTTDSVIDITPAETAAEAAEAPEGADGPEGPVEATPTPVEPEVPAYEDASDASSPAEIVADEPFAATDDALVVEDALPEYDDQEQL